MKTLILTENNFGFWDTYRRFCKTDFDHKTNEECKRLSKYLFQ